MTALDTQPDTQFLSPSQPEAPVLPVIARVRLRGGEIRVCRIPEGLSLSLGQACIIHLNDSQEWCHVQELAETHGGEADAENNALLGEVLRIASDADAQSLAETLEKESEALNCFREHIRRLGLPMRPLRARFSFDRHRLLLMFGADHKVDFRRLIYHLRHDMPGVFVELRHLGIRDEAGLIGGFGPCGRQLCCATWIERFRAVNIRMARAQDLPFNPQTVSGMCGRLKCCLRYEYDLYREAGAKFPREGAEVAWGEDEHGTVIGREVLNGRVTVRTPDRRVLHLDLETVSRYEPDGPDPHDDSHDDLEDDAPPPHDDDPH